MDESLLVDKTYLNDQFKKYSQVLKEKFVMKGEGGEGESELEHDITCNVSVGNAPSGTVLPQGMTFNSNLNPDWYTGTDGNLYTKALADIELVSGESKEIKLVLTKQMTDESTEIVSNSAEISDDFNIYGVSDRNSKPSNKAQNEDDMSTADTILTIKTGESLIYVSGIIIGLMLGGAVAFIVYERVLKNKRKGGV